ncbi:hypothetical protein [Tardiphaga sp. 11_C7_N12_6]|uniref:hypothetical protein n=1 Tax=Tardiphaga sp. 11_C7_N12_6 TaxID=3240789 RepID=UPI003F2489BD
MLCDETVYLLIHLTGVFLITKEDFFRRKAQREAAKKDSWLRRAADPIALLTLALVVVAVFQLVIIRRQTEILTSTDETQRLTLEASKSTQSAALFVKSIWWRAVASPAPQKWWALIEWENSGTTPTKEATLHVACYFRRPGAEFTEDPYAYRNGQPWMAIVQALLGSRQTKFGGQCIISNETFLQVQQGRLSMFVMAEANYKDIFDNMHRTRFCEFVHSVQGNVMSGDPGLTVASSACPRFNCIDDQCKKQDFTIGG